MLFCINADYTAQALTALRANPVNRQDAFSRLVEEAGGKVVVFYGTIADGPGVLTIFDVPDPNLGPAICGIIKSSGALENVTMKRLFTMDEVSGFRKRAAQLAGAYKAPGQ